MISLFQCKDTKKYLKMREINEEYSISPIFFRAKCPIPPNGVDGIRIEKCRQDLTCRHFLLVFVLFYDMQLVTPREAAIAVKIDSTI